MSDTRSGLPEARAWKEGAENLGLGGPQERLRAQSEAPPPRRLCRDASLLSPCPPFVLANLGRWRWGGDPGSSPRSWGARAPIPPPTPLLPAPWRGGRGRALPPAGRGLGEATQEVRAGAVNTRRGSWAGKGGHRSCARPRGPNPGRPPRPRARRTYPSSSNSPPRTPATASKTSSSCCRPNTTV